MTNGVRVTQFPDIPGDIDASPNPVPEPAHPDPFLAGGIPHGGARGHPRDDPPEHPGVRRQPGHPGQLPRAGLRPVRGAEPVGDEHLDQEVALPRGRHLHLRELPRVPQAEQPQRHLGAQPARGRMAPDADHAGAPGELLHALPALRQEHRPGDQREHGHDLLRRSLPGATRGQASRRRRAQPRHRPGQHAVLRPRGVQHAAQHGLHVVGALLPAHVDDHAALLRVRLGLLLQRRLGHPDARRRAGPDRQPDRDARPGLDRRLGRQGEHQLLLHPQRRVAALRARQAVPRRAQRDLGRRPDQHRPQLPEPPHPEAPRLERPDAGTGAAGDVHRPALHRQLARGRPVHVRGPSTARPTARRAPHAAASWSRCSACSSSSASTATRSPGSGTAQTTAALRAFQARVGHPRRDIVTLNDWVSLRRGRQRRHRGAARVEGRRRDTGAARTQRRGLAAPDRHGELQHRDGQRHRRLPAQGRHQRHEDRWRRRPGQRCGPAGAETSAAAGRRLRRAAAPRPRW